jgi:glycosyltransferase involved in cell wall biosynthesis
MKILHFVPSYFPAYRQGGPILSVHSLNKSLVKRGVEVVVYTTNINGPALLDVPVNQEVVVDGVKVWYFPLTFRPWEYSYNLHKALSRNLKDFDLLHITSVFLSASALGAYYAKRFHKPYIISPRGTLMMEPLARKKPILKRIYLFLIEKRNLRDAAAIHFTAEAEKREYLEQKLPLRKAIIVPNGLDPAQFQIYEAKFHKVDFRRKFGIGRDKKIVLFLSRINWKKGLDTLIPAFAEVVKKEPKAVLVLAGPDDENYKKEVELKIENCKLKIDKEVIFTGMLLGENKISAFRAADVFVLPSYSENFGMAVVEAMSFGLPVVITDKIGIAPSVKKTGAGLVVPKNEKAVSGAVLRILGNSREVRQMGEKGKKLVRDEFSPDAVSHKFIRVYEEIIGER